jgi:glycosyltransferase involved in cell wall biosynthesis
MKILVITYTYTPDLTPRAFRWSAIASQLVSRGHEVHVLCASAQTELVEYDGVNVHRVQDWLINGSSRVAPGAQKVSFLRDRGLSILFKGFLHKTLRAVWRFLYWPDSACGWTLPASIAARSLQKKIDFDWIISSSHPFTGHLVGLLFKLLHPNIKWFVDISDPYSLMVDPSPYNRLIYGWLSFSVESIVVSRADVLCMTTKSTANLYEAHFSKSKDKVIVIPPLMSLPPAPISSRGSDGVLRLIFIGTLYRSLRSPRYLLTCFSALKKFYPERKTELHFYGAINDCAEDLLVCPEFARDSIFVHGLVERSVVIQAMVDSDVLVNIGNDSETQLASKVIEYMAMARPILNIISIDRDTSVEVLSDHPAVFTMRRFIDGPSKEQLESLANFLFDLPIVPTSYANAVRESYSKENIAHKYANIIEANGL